MYRVQSRESKGFRASMGALGACLGALRRVLGVLFGPLGSRGASFAALRVSSGALGWVLELPRAPFGALGASLGAPERQKTSKKPPSDTPSSLSPSFFLQIRRQYSTFPTFLRMRRGESAQVGGRPGGMWERPGRNSRRGKEFKSLQI